MKEDVEQFLWELETHLAELSGDRRLEEVKRVERELDRLAGGYAERDGRDTTTWHDYVQATADLGPPERLAAEVLGHPPSPGRSSKRAFVLAGIAGVLLLVAVAIGVSGPNDFTQVGSWSAEETQRTGQFNATFEVAPDAERVRVDLSMFPVNQAGQVRVLVLDGGVSPVFEGTATVSDALQTTRMLDGEPGTWRVIIDFREYTGPWRVTVFEAR